MIKKLHLIILVVLVFSINTLSAQENRWTAKNNESITLSYELPSDYKVFELDEQALVNDVLPAPNWQVVAARQSATTISLPNENGEMVQYTISEASVMEPVLQAQFPTIRSYIGQATDGSSAVLRMSYSPQEGFGGMIRKAGVKTVFFAKDKATSNYVFYQRIDNGGTALRCSTAEFNNVGTPNNITQRSANSGVLSTFRLAMTCNGEYGTWAGGTTTAVMAKFNATMTRVNGVYEQELAIHMNLIANTTDLIYLDAGTDPYTGLNNSQIQSNITSVIGEANYDIGHLVGQGGDGGNAGFIGCVCADNQKGSAYTSRAVPEGDTFDIDYVAHEMGHQFGGNHTWTSVFDATNSVSIPHNEGYGASLEPGSGSTIMAYAGITGSNAAGISTDVQANSDDYFHFYSIQQITNYIATTSCQTTANLSQTTPTANAGADYTIPKNTPFVLTGSGTSDGTTTYCWEQNDLGGYSEDTTLPTPSSTSGPSFRSLRSTASPKRYLPNFQSVVAGDTYSFALGTKWELLNTVGRTYNFKLTVRDNIAGGAQNNVDAMQVVVDGTTGPFTVTSQTASAIWSTGETKTITWNVAGTNANGVNTANVNILLVDATDATVLATLLSNTPNDGSETVTVPNITSSSALIMVEAVNNIYYAVNSAALSINTGTNPPCTGLCTSSGSTQFADGVTRVQFNTINNASTGLPAYTDNTSISTHVTANSSYNLTVNVNTDGNYTEEVVVWIDWNRDCSFNTTDEQYNLGTVTNVTDGATANAPLSITVPATVTPGDITMRVSSGFIGSTSSGTTVVAPTACETGFWGEVEDYTITIDATAVISENTFETFTITPNPSNGTFNVELQSNEDVIKIELYDISGRLIYTNDFDNNQSIFNKTIHLTNVKTGVYLVNVFDGTHFDTEQLIIK